MQSAAQLRAQFQELYKSEPRIFRAPGRVNLIGEHTDYNEGFVMPEAIAFSTRVAVAPSNSRTLRVYSTNFKEQIVFDLDEPNPKARKHWSDYVRGVAAAIENTGHRLTGADLLIEGGVPLGSGLSSSAAIEVSTALALLATSGISLDRTSIAQLCQRAENEFVGAHSGIMDQFISCYGKAGHALMLDCRSLDFTYLPIPDHVQLVACNTMVHHELASGEYNLRRRQCEEGVRDLRKFLPEIHSLRDVDESTLLAHETSLEPLIYRRCRHVVTENQRVLDAAAALKSGDARRFGELMIQSHESLRDDYQVSSPELDLMVKLALPMKGVYGARMTGGGFGGSTVNMVESGATEEFAREIERLYREASGGPCEIYICPAADGAVEEPPAKGEL